MICSFQFLLSCKDRFSSRPRRFSYSTPLTRSWRIENGIRFFLDTPLINSPFWIHWIASSIASFDQFAFFCNKLVIPDHLKQIPLVKFVCGDYRSVVRNDNHCDRHCPHITLQKYYILLSNNDYFCFMRHCYPVAYRQHYSTITMVIDFWWTVITYIGFFTKGKLEANYGKKKNLNFLLWETMPQWCLPTKSLGRAPEESSAHQKVSEYSHSRGKRVIGISLWSSLHPVSLIYVITSFSVVFL
jgi:hypothetical protein